MSERKCGGCVHWRPDAAPHQDYGRCKVSSIATEWWGAASVRADRCPAYLTPSEHRLREAAPRLLEACRGIKDFLGFIESSRKMTDEEWEVWLRLRAAIAATEEEPKP